uniref:Amino acid transporter transmembrane domain-containing protein n=1 Tax=Meloidogyne javanica TaxID=6303 RepID=A0A915N038_MELJA
MQESDLYQQQQPTNNVIINNGVGEQTSNSTDSSGELRSLVIRSECRQGDVSFILTVVIAGFNWFGNHILVRSSQHLAKKTGVPSLDYGHFAKRVCDKSDIPFLRSNSKRIMYVVNITILFYQLGMCSVAILFIAENLIHLLGWLLGSSTTIMATIATIFIMATNMFTEMRVISLFAMISSVFFLLGAGVIMHFTLQQPSHWSELPASTNFADTIIFIGMSMYAFEGQTMILPIENKLDNPDDFLDNFGVLPTTMCLCTLFMTAIGFFGYNAFGDKVAETITINVPHTGLYSVVNVFLCVQSILGHSIAMYVVFDMFYKGFRRKFSIRFPTVSDFVIDKGFRFFWVFITYLMAVLIPRLAVLIPLVGHIPSMVLSGHCIDWASFIRLLNELLPNINIKKAKSSDICKIFDEIKADKLILFLEHDGSDYLFFKEFVEKIKEMRMSTYLIFLTPISFSSVYEKMPRRVAIHLRLSNAAFHPFDAFLRILFEETLPLCFLHSNGVLIKAPTQRLFEMDNRSLNSVRKSLLLALCFYSTLNRKPPTKKELITIQTQMKIYSSLLGWFSIIFCLNGGKTALHCKLQNNSEFFKILLDKLKLSSKNWTKDNWKGKLQSLLSILQQLGAELERERVNCKQLINNLENYNKMNEEVENNAPESEIVNSTKNDGNPRLSRSRFPIRKSLNTSSFLLQREKDLKRLRNPLSDTLYNELLNYLNTLFLDRCMQQKWKFIAEYNSIDADNCFSASLSPALSAEIDYQLGEISKYEFEKVGQKQQQQLDICLVYGILVQHGIDKSAIQLTKLFDNFYEFAPEIDGMELNARFMAAIAQNMSTHSQSNGESISIVDGDEALKSQGGVDVTEDKLVSISSVSSSADDRSVGNSTDEDVQGFPMSKSLKNLPFVGGYKNSLRDNADLEEREELLATGDELQETDVELIDSGNEVSLLDEKHEAARGRAISRLIGFSLVLIIVPLTAMYLSYRFIFTGNFCKKIILVAIIW